MAPAFPTNPLKRLLTCPTHIGAFVKRHSTPSSVNPSDSLGHPTMKEETQVPDSKPSNSPEPPAENSNNDSVPDALRLVFCGSTKWDMQGRKTLPKSVKKRGGSAEAGEEHPAPIRLQFSDLPDQFSSVHTGPLAAHLVLITGGCAYGMGRNDTGQIGQDDLRSRRHPVLLYPSVRDGETIISAACGRSHTLLVSSHGRAFAAGSNVSGQLGNGGKTELRKPGVCEWQVVKIPSKEEVIGVAAGGDFSVFCCKSGAVFTAGSGQYGQLGNGRTGECIQSNSRVGYDVVTNPVCVQFPAEVKITQVAAGSNHVLGLDNEQKVWSWGWGGYGQLGHRTPGDELRPRKVDMFSGPNYHLDFVSAGATASYAVQQTRKSVYFWGVTKKSGESNMYPKTLFDLQGWLVRSLACGQTSTVVAAENSVISWGASPTYGELGYGNGPKSSTKPKVVDAVEGLQVMQVGVGLSFTVMLVRVTGDEMKEVFEKLAVVSEEGEVGSKRKNSNGSQAKGRAKKRRK